MDITARRGTTAMIQKKPLRLCRWPGQLMSILCLLFILLMTHERLSALTESEYEQLWQVDTTYMTPADRNEWKQRVQAADGLQAHLVKKIRSSWEGGNPELLLFLFKALAHRTDLSDNELSVLTKPIEERLAQGLNSSPENRAFTLYASGLVRTLGNYPSVRHEELAIALTASETGSIYANAALTLAKIGGHRSLEALRKLLDRIKPPEGKTDVLYDEVLTATHDLERRLARAEPVPAQGDPAPSIAPPKSAPAPPTKLAGDTSRNDREAAEASIFQWWSGAAVVVFVSLFIVFIRTRRRSPAP